jgi:hypothetical protein
MFSLSVTIKDASLCNCLSGFKFDLTRFSARAQTYTPTHKCTHTQSHTPRHTNKYKHIHTPVCTYTHTHTHTHTIAYFYTHKQMQAHSHASVHIHTHTHTHTHAQTLLLHFFFTVLLFTYSLFPCASHGLKTASPLPRILYIEFCHDPPFFWVQEFCGTAYQRGSSSFICM